MIDKTRKSNEQKPREEPNQYDIEKPDTSKIPHDERGKDDQTDNTEDLPPTNP